LRVGTKGAWNDQTLCCFCVLDFGDRFHLYTGGARYGQKKNIGVATSRDGIHWTWYERNPLFAGSMPYVIKVGDELRLYYSGGHAGLPGLQMRRSRDGFHWSQPQKVFRGCADPCVVHVADDRFHLYFCHGRRKVKDGKNVWEFRIHLATSADGIRWQERPGPILPLGPAGSWEAEGHAGPVVLKLPDAFHMWYLGAGQYRSQSAWRIGHATSPDGLHWTKSGTEPVLDIGRPGAWDGGTLMSFDIVFRDGRLLFWYAADPGKHRDETTMSIQIGFGTSRDGE
ncbi:MAG: hypothetical protein GXP27_19885, partial [Planctomycetes bacterium]|nr:hypothetical protein [Planctomycetota bacterium]